MAANADLLPQPAVVTAVGIGPALAAAFMRPSLALAAILAGFGSCCYAGRLWLPLPAVGRPMCPDHAIPSPYALLGLSLLCPFA